MTLEMMCDLLHLLPQERIPYDLLGGICSNSWCDLWEDVLIGYLWGYHSFGYRCQKGRLGGTDGWPSILEHSYRCKYEYHVQAELLIGCLPPCRAYGSQIL